ncbi:serine/threonine-protein phosphatase PGAM5, mitochondrial-like [Discoglossus pictus]
MFSCTMFARRVLLAGGSAATAVLLASVAVRKCVNEPAQPCCVWPPVLSSQWDYNWDRREPASLINLSKVKLENKNEDLNVLLKKNKAKATRHIFLIRHCQYNMDGHNDSEHVLTALGRQQAELTGNRLAKLGYKYDHVVHSSLTRTTETTKIICSYLPGVKATSTDLLTEGSPIRPNPASRRHPDVAYYDDGARIEAAFRKYIHRSELDQSDDTYEIIISHENVIRYIVCRALQFPPEGWLRMSLNHGSITNLVIRPNGKVSLRMLGDSGFMPPEKVTRS